jgi:hypothetical protein
VASARFITWRPPLTRSRLMAKAAQVATNRVATPVVIAMKKLLPSCSQKLLR